MTRHLPVVLVVLGVVVLGGMACLAPGQNAPGGEPDSLLGQWSEPVGGRAVRLTAERALYHPGEVIHLQAEARDAGKTGIRFLGGDSGNELHLLTPAGEHLIRDWPGTGGWDIRLLKSALGWRPAADPKAKPVDLSRVGHYVFWCEHAVKPEAVGKDPPVWVGKVASPKVELTLRDLTAAEIKRELTPAQRDDLRVIVQGLPNELRLANERLVKALLRAENVGLADAATALVVEQINKGQGAAMGELYQGLIRRAVEVCWAVDMPPVQLAIRGDYLRPLAEMQLKKLQAGFGSGSGSIEVLLALCLESKDEPLRKPLAAIALAHAKLANPGQRDQVRLDEERLMLAWNLLHSLETLVGQTEAEVIAILGPPTSRQPNILMWDAASPMHVNPFIGVVLDEAGKVKSVNCGRR